MPVPEESSSVSMTEVLPFGITSSERGSKPASHVTIETLPNELLLNIFGHLDSPQPSAAAAALYDEPTFNLTQSEVADLKTISCVSKRWREAVIPVLFRHSQLIIPKTNSKGARKAGADIKQILDFITRNQLRKAITSFTLICYDEGFAETYTRDCSQDIPVFWNSLFSVIDPNEVLIVAPVEALSFFTGCLVNDEDSWSFDCPCQYLRLRRTATLRTNDSILGNEEDANQAHSQSVGSIPTSSTVPNLPGGLPNSPDISTDEEARAIITDRFERTLRGDPIEVDAKPVFADSSVLFNHPWSKLLLNEGSYIKAYSTYEFWERRPPSVCSPHKKRLICPNRYIRFYLISSGHLPAHLSSALQLETWNTSASSPWNPTSPTSPQNSPA